MKLAANMSANPIDGLLLIVNDVGIPLLVECFGACKVPPYAILGIASALHYASREKGSDTKSMHESEEQLHALESKHRSIIYRASHAHDILLVFIFERDTDQFEPILPQGYHSIFQLALDRVYHLIHMSASHQVVQSEDVSQMKSILYRIVDVIRYIITGLWTNIGLAFGRSLGIFPTKEVDSCEENQDFDLSSCNKTDRKFDVESKKLEKICRIVVHDFVVIEHSTFSQLNQLAAPSTMDISLLVTILNVCQQKQRANGQSNRTWHKNLYFHIDQDNEVCLGVVFTTTTFASSIDIYNKQVNSLPTDDLTHSLSTYLTKDLPGLNHKLGSCIPQSIMKNLPRSLACCIISRGCSLVPSNCKMLCLLNPHWKQALLECFDNNTEDDNGLGDAPKDLELYVNPLTEVDENLLWQLLYEFAIVSMVSLRNTESEQVSYPQDYMRTDELLTFGLSIRGPLQLFWLSVAHIDLETFINIGDTLGDHFLMHM